MRHVDINAGQHLPRGVELPIRWSGRCWTLIATGQQVPFVLPQAALGLREPYWLRASSLQASSCSAGGGVGSLWPGERLVWLP
jgi:hypothetical protein